MFDSIRYKWSLSILSTYWMSPLELYFPSRNNTTFTVLLRNLQKSALCHWLALLPSAGFTSDLGSEFVPLKKRWICQFYPAAQDVTDRMLFWNAHTFKTISLLPKHYHLIHWSSVFSTIQRKYQQSTRNISYIMSLCCTLVRKMT